MKKLIFEGVATALITPFKSGKVDYTALSAIIDMQIDSGVDALVIGGTTGEAATLTDSERYSIFELAHERAGGRVKLIFGTGTNDTAAAIRHTRAAERIGCDGVLVVTPYYNKGTEDGIYAHYASILDSVSLPVLLYNVPSRTGVNLSLSVIDRLIERENLVGIKEASDSADRLVTLAAYGERLWLYAGNDSQFFTSLALGGKGVISVLSNAYPHLVSQIYTLFRDGRLSESLKAQTAILPLVRAIFAETNPAPIKYLMHTLGYAENELRLPLAPVTPATAKTIEKVIVKSEE